MTTYERGAEIALAVTGKYPELLVTVDPRSATPPCVLIAPPNVDHNGFCGQGLAEWALFALVPNPGNADAWRALDELLAAVEDVLPIERHEFLSYTLAVDNPAVPAYRMIFHEGVTL